MPKYIIEREIPQAGNFDIEQLKSIYSVVEPLSSIVKHAITAGDDFDS